MEKYVESTSLLAYVVPIDLTSKRRRPKLYGWSDGVDDKQRDGLQHVLVIVVCLFVGEYGFVL